MGNALELIWSVCVLLSANVMVEGTAFAGAPSNAVMSATYLSLSVQAPFGRPSSTLTALNVAGVAGMSVPLMPWSSFGSSYTADVILSNAGNGFSVMTPATMLPCESSSRSLSESVASLASFAFLTVVCCPCQAVPVFGVNLSLNPEPAGMEPIS